MKSRTDNISSEAKTSKCIAYDSRWMIISVIVLTLFLFCLEGRAQLVSSNPMEYVALAEGNEPVSYTHLGVYKRQMLYFFCRLYIQLSIT